MVEPLVLGILDEPRREGVERPGEDEQAAPITG